MGSASSSSSGIDIREGAKLDIHGTLTMTGEARRSTIQGRSGGQLYVHNGGEIQYTTVGGHDFSLAGPGRGLFTMTLADGAAFHGEGAGLNVNKNVDLTANGNLYTECVTIQGGGKYKEKSTVTIDGVGKTNTTRYFITIYNGYNTTPAGIYEGNVIVDHPLAADARDDGGLVIWGTLRGNVELRRGLVNFWRGGTIEGNLTASGGTVLVSNGEDTSEDRPPTAIYGDIRINGGSFVIEPNLALTLEKGISVSKGALEAAEATLTSKDDINITNGANAAIGTLSDFSHTLKVGDSADTQGGSTLSASLVELKSGGKLLVDPAWGLAPSNVAIEKLSVNDSNGVSLDGQIGVGMNSYLALGTKDTNWLPQEIAKTGTSLSRGATESVVGIYRPLTLASGAALRADGTQDNAALESSLASAGNTASFGSKSLLVLNGNDAALQAGQPAVNFAAPGGTLEAHDGAQVFIAEAKPGVRYKVADKNTNEIRYIDASGNVVDEAQATAWKGENLLSSSGMVRLVYQNGEFVAQQESAASVYPQLDPADASLVDSMYAAGLNDTQSSFGGVRFLSRATDSTYIADNNLAATTIGSATRMAFAGAVPQMTLAANRAAGWAVEERARMARTRAGMKGINGFGAPLDTFNRGFALWAVPLFQSVRGTELQTGTFEYDYRGVLAGVALGADYTFENGLRLGATANVGGGRSHSSGNLHKTTNKVTFGGGGLYAGWKKGAFGLSADVNYTSTNNELKQDVPSAMRMPKLKSDVRAHALGAGLRAEYRLPVKSVDIKPHVGARYTALRVENHHIKSSDTVAKVNGSTQNIWTLPVGVSVSRDFTLDNGMRVKPVVDVNVTPAIGDRKAKSRVRFTGVDKTASIHAKVMDHVTGGGLIGLEISRDNMSLGISYNGQFGKKTAAHGAFCAFRYEF